MGTHGRTAGLALGSGLLLVAASAASTSLVMTAQGGSWPNDWAVELEDVREQATTIDVATGLQERIYEIPLTDRDTFEAAWPGVLREKSPGGTLTLVSVGAPDPGWPGTSNAGPAPSARATYRNLSIGCITKRILAACYRFFCGYAVTRHGVASTARWAACPARVAHHLPPSLRRH